MCKYYGQIDQMVGCHVGPITNDGMGVRMLHGVGAGDRGTPRWPAVLSESGIDTVTLGLPWTLPHEHAGFEDRQLSAYTYAGINLARQANLKVNVYGKRFMKEDLDWQPRLWTEFQQPGHRFYSIFDGDIEANIAETNQRYGMCEYLITPDRAVYFNDDDIRNMWDWQEELQDAIDRGFIVKADTLEELAEGLGINVENFVATVEHYNELVDSGVDSDYGKQECLFPVRKAPFYGIPRCTGFAWQVQGSIAMDAATGRVLDTKGAVIPGLYCGSNDGTAADCDTEVNFMTPTGGGAAGAITAGYLAGNAAAEEAIAAGLVGTVVNEGATTETVELTETDQVLDAKCTMCHSAPTPGTLSPMTDGEAEEFLSDHIGLLSGEEVAGTIDQILPGNVNR